MRVVILACLVACAGGPQRTPAAMPRSVLEGHAGIKAPLEWKDIVVVRHRRLLGSPLLALADDAPPPIAAPMSSPEPRPEKLVVEAWLDVRVNDVARTVDDLTARVEAAGGRIVSSNVDGASSAALELRVPPARTAELAGWLDHAGTIESRRTLGTDVDKQLVDQELELQNLRITMSRLEQLATRDLPLAELLEVEKEMTRVRGEIERVEGEQRWLVDRVELATLHVTLSHEGGPIELAHARVYPGARFASLVLVDPGTRPATRLGGGMTVRLDRALTFDLELFPRDGGDGRAVLATIGSALYSDYLGGGHRRWLNPYLGARLGYGYLSGTGGVLFAGELGIELFRDPHVLVEVATRALLVAHDPSNDAAIESLLGCTVPF